MTLESSQQVVVAGFLGAVAYSPSCYLFPDGHSYSAQLFSVALQDYLEKHDRAPSLWLVLGTNGSAWSALAEAVPLERQAELSEMKAQLEQLQPTKDERGRPGVEQELLDQWGALLSALTGRPTRCVLAGSADSEEGQYAIWNALESIGKNDTSAATYDVVFDITNGLRHQPVLATYSVMLLRWLRQINRIEFCYGAFEIKKTDASGQACCPAVFLPFCERLTQACEAVATHTFTGDFRQIGRALQLPDEIERQLERVAYADELNRPQREQADTLRREIRAYVASAPPPAGPLAEKLDQSLQWVAESRLDEQYIVKAEQAYKQQQYFKAVAYLYEAVLIADFYCNAPARAELLYFGNRDESRKRLTDHRGPLTKDQRRAFTNLMHLRNAVLHGTEAKGPTGIINHKVERAVESETALAEIFRNGLALWKELSRKIPPLAFP